MDNACGVLHEKCARKSSGDAVRAAMSPSIDHDDVVVPFKFFGDAQPGQPVLVEAVKEEQCRLLASRAIVVVAYAVGEDVTLAPMCRDELLNGTVVFHYSLQTFLLFTHHDVLSKGKCTLSIGYELPCENTIFS